MCGTELTGSDRNERLPVNLPGQESWPSGCGSARAGPPYSTTQELFGGEVQLHAQFATPAACGSQQQNAQKKWHCKLHCANQTVKLGSNREIRGESSRMQCLLTVFLTPSVSTEQGMRNESFRNRNFIPKHFGLFIRILFAAVVATHSELFRQHGQRRKRVSLSQRNLMRV